MCGAYVWWGASAIFWRQLSSVDPIEQFAFRIVLAFATLVIGVGLLRRRLTAAGVDASLFDPGSRRDHLRRAHLLYGVGAALAIGTNWALFLWSVGNGRAVEAALGYFLMPICSVALGVGLLGERLSPLQWAAITLSIVGILWNVLALGRLPVVALLVGISFALYGLFRKEGPWDPISGLTFETGFLAPAVLLVLVLRGASGVALTGDGRATTILLLSLTGAVTALPLLAFATAAQRVPLTVLGLLQYLNPTLQFLVGWRVLGEAVTSTRLIGFVWIWAALVLVVIDEGLPTGRGSRAA
ncbi:MAG: EamA family transporter RarD [Actinomycetota bacterium]